MKLKPTPRPGHSLFSSISSPSHEAPCQRARRPVALRRGVRRGSCGAGFTLVEILVALAIMSLLLTIIFVPLNQAFNFLGIGQSKTKLQQASRQTLSQIELDLKRAIYVYPNDVLPSVTNNAPFNQTPTKGTAPYFETQVEAGITGNAAAYDVCAAIARTGSSGRVGNVSRIDMLLPDIDNNGQVLSPVTPGNYLVSYYARRLRADQPYDNMTNPIVWFRAQMPFRKNDPSNPGDFLAPDLTTAFNVRTGSKRYPTSCTPDDSRGSRWLVQDSRKEANLEPLCADAPSTVPGTHTLALPRGMSLIAPGANLETNPNYQPDASFVVEDVNRDGKVDQVTINLSLEQYDTSTVGNTNGNRPKSTDRLGVQRVRDSIVVNLPNVN